MQTWNGSAFANPDANFFVYDGWRPAAVLTHSMKVVQSCAWGLDLTGGKEEAGSISGSPTNLTVADNGNSPVAITAYSMAGWVALNCHLSKL